MNGIVSATRCNHGQNLSFAGAAGGLGVTIVMPEGNSPDKNVAMRAFGAKLIADGHDFSGRPGGCPGSGRRAGAGESGEHPGISAFALADVAGYHTPAPPIRGALMPSGPCGSGRTGRPLGATKEKCLVPTP